VLTCRSKREQAGRRRGKGEGDGRKEIKKGRKEGKRGRAILSSLPAGLQETKTKIHVSWYEAEGKDEGMPRSPMMRETADCQMPQLPVEMFAHDTLD
jgi:hypothetical protein